jgi:hypothetical protein
MITDQVHPIEFYLSPGSYSDTNELNVYWFALSVGTHFTDGKSYADYIIDDVMSEAHIMHSPLLKKYSPRLYHLGFTT